MATPRVLAREERTGDYAFSRQAFVTDDAEPLDVYNCFGFAVGIRHFLRPTTREQGYGCLYEWGYICKAPQDTDEVIYLFHNPANANSPWHVAKRLRGRWIESKCGPGLRIVHDIGDVPQGYGTFHSPWVRDTSTYGFGRRAAAIQKELSEAKSFGECPPDISEFSAVEDSAAVLDDLLNRFGARNDDR